MVSGGLITLPQVKHSLPVAIGPIFLLVTATRRPCSKCVGLSFAFSSERVRPCAPEIRFVVHSQNGLEDCPPECAVDWL